MQRNNNYLNYSFTWTCPILIKNNSRYTAERIEFILPEEYNISSQNMNNLLNANNHLESYKELALETEFTKIVPYEDVVNTYIEEDGTRVSSPGTKMNDPAEYFKPESLKAITVIVRYKSESDKTFYTLYKSINGKETNKIYLFNPLKLRWLVGLK
jgi:hypothetical protein